MIIDHGGGKETLYQHMSSTTIVEKGEIVAAGAILGYVGSIGIASGLHLHFEVRIGGTPMDPLQYYE